MRRDTGPPGKARGPGRRTRLRFYAQSSAAELDPRAKPGAPAAVGPGRSEGKLSPEKCTMGGMYAMSDFESAEMILSSSTRRLPILLALFAASGCAALIYEIVWFQMLELVIGSTALSLAVLLGTYMGGMGLGSLLLPRIIPPERHPLRVYAGLELVIGAMGIILLFGMPFVGRLYAAGAGAGLPLRGLVSAVCLLLPTMAMGATLPLVSRWIQTTPQGASWMGFLYGSNTLGAVAGCLLAGFYLLRVHDIAVATFTAAAINTAVAGLALLLAARNPRSAPAAPFRAATAESEKGHGGILAAIALSGLTALGAEVIWTRLLSLMLGGTVYAFSIILAVFLAGLGVGSAVGSAAARGTASPRRALAVCQALLTAGIAWTAFLLARSLPFWPINTMLSRSPWSIFQLDFVRCLWAVFVPACLWGASFPLALAAVVPRGRDAGRSVGRVYASNTAGAIIGSILFSLFLIPRLGTAGSQKLIIFLSAVACVIALAPFRRVKGRAFTAEADPRLKRGAATAAAAFEMAGGTTRHDPGFGMGDAVLGGTALILAVVLAWSVPRLPWELVAWGRSLPTRTATSQALYVGEGMNSSVAVTKLEGGTLNFHVSGKVEASSDPTDMRLERMLGHLPALLHPRPKSVLIVGCGAGITAGTFVTYPGVERIVICEIEPLIPRVVARFFGVENHGVLDDPRVQVVFDDARHFILTAREKFDIITSDPIHPWIKGSAALYSHEYFQMGRARLKPGGLITQWVPLYESTPETVKSELATFFSVFPDGSIWGNDIDGMGYDIVLLGQEGPLAVDLDALEARLARPDYQVAAQSLRDVGFTSAFGLFSTYAGRGPDFRDWLKDAAVNRDRNMRLQYLAGLGLNTAQSVRIYDEILRRRTFPEGAITGRDDKLALLRELIGLKAK
jgi:spermidine synthase